MMEKKQEKVGQVPEPLPIPMKSSPSLGIRAALPGNLYLQIPVATLYMHLLLLKPTSIIKLIKFIANLLLNQIIFFFIPCTLLSAWADKHPLQTNSRVSLGNTERSTTIPGVSFDSHSENVHQTFPGAAEQLNSSSQTHQKHIAETEKLKPRRVIYSLRLLKAHLNAFQ